MFWKDPYLAYMRGFAKLTKRSLPLQQGDGESCPVDHKPQRLSQKPCALLLMPHPDDECLTGALSLRLKRELGWQIINVSITLGSKPERKNERWDELTSACQVLEFDQMQAVPEGFATVRLEVRATQPKIWEKMARHVAEIIKYYNPQAVFLPHEHDAHYTHVGTHFLGMDALAQMPKSFECYVVQTEYWQPQENPNCLIGIDKKSAARLLKALCCHKGEIARNAYHKRFPAYLMDNVRRGSERVGGEGGKDLPFDFAMLYRIDRWQNGRIEIESKRRYIFGPNDPVKTFLPDGF